MGFDYDRSDVHTSYDASRRLPEATLKLWMQAISDTVPKASVELIADVGCGTGRFSGALSNHFSSGVIGVDPSANMLRTALARGAGSVIGLAQGSGEAIPLRTGTADLAFLSMVYHHILDKGAALCEFRRILRARGFLCIRTSTSDAIDTYPWVRFFPEAREIELARAPSRRDMPDLPGRNGFALEKAVGTRKARGLLERVAGAAS